MRMIDKVAAQGEITIYRKKVTVDVVAFLAGGKPLPVEKGRFIIGHSETGHHHVIERNGVDVFEMPSPEGIRILRMIVADPDKELVHERSYDTHEAIGLPPGQYEIRIGREYDPYAELVRQQQD